MRTTDGRNEVNKNNPKNDDKKAALRRAPDERSTEQGDGDAMSPSMRRLILSFLGSDPDRSFDRDALIRGTVLNGSRS
jgi:hypothetical protein